MIQKDMVPKAEKSNCDVDDDTDSCSSCETINMLYCSSPTREEIHLPNNKIQNYCNFESW